MKRNCLCWGWCMICVCALWSCNKIPLLCPPGHGGHPVDTGKVTYGDIHGTVKVYDTSGVELPSFAGVTVSIDSTGLSTTTDAAGNFQLLHVKAGTYNFKFFKDSSYGITRIYQKAHTGGTQATELGNTDVGAICQGPTFSYLVLQDPVGGPENPHLYYFGYIDHWLVTSWAIITFFDTDSSVSPLHYRKAQREQHIFTTPPEHGDGPPEFNNQDEFSQALIRSDSALINSTQLWYALVFDNPHPISYVNEQGITIHPCIGPVKIRRWVNTSGYYPSPNNP